MARLKLIWLGARDASVRYCCYGYVRLAVYHELQESVDGRDKFRIKILEPKGVKLGGRCTFDNRKQAEDLAELEVVRIQQNRAPIDFDRVEEWRGKAEAFDKVSAITAQFGRKPEQAAYELAQMYEMTGDRKPVDAVAQWIDEFERVKIHLTVNQVVQKEIARIKKSRRMSTDTKRDKTNILLEFAEEIEGTRFIDEVSVDDMEEYYGEMDCGVKRAYTRWLTIRDVFWLAYRRYGAVTKWVYEHLIELDFSAKANGLTSVMKPSMLVSLFGRCQFANDALYLGILAWVPLRRAELRRLEWKHIKCWANGRPRHFDLPHYKAKGDIGFQAGRFLDIPENLADLLLAFWRETGPIIVEEGHQERLAILAKEIDPLFGWPHNILRRSCISHGVADTNDKAYWQSQAGHDKKSQAKYLVPVDPVVAKEYRASATDLARLRTLPFVATDCPKKRGRPTSSSVEQLEVVPKPASTASVDRGSKPTVPEPARRTDGGIDWKGMSDKFLAGLLKAHNLIEIIEAWGVHENNLRRQFSKRKIIVPPKPVAPAAPAILEKPAQRKESNLPNPAAAKTEGTEIPAVLGEPEPIATQETKPIGQSLASAPGDCKPVHSPDTEFGKAPRETATPVASPRRTRKGKYTWPSKLKFLEMLWMMPAPHIAAIIRCSHEAVMWKRRQWELPAPGYGFWQKNRAQMLTLVPQSVKDLYLTLRKAATPEELAGEIPEVFRTHEESAAPANATTADQNPTIADGASAETETEKISEIPPVTHTKSQGPRKRGPRKFIFPMPPADLLEQLWLKPASRIGERVGCSDGRVIAEAKFWKLPLPPSNFWQCLKHGEKITIPSHIQCLIEELRRTSQVTEPAPLVPLILINDNRSRPPSITPKSE